MRIFTPLLLSVFAAGIALAQTEPESPAPPPEVPVVKPLPPEEAAKIADHFAALSKEFESKKKDIANLALGRYSSAAMSENAAVQFYFECQKMLDDRKPDVNGPDTKKDAKDKADKTRRQYDSIQDTPGYGAVLQLQLQFLVLTMEAPGVKDYGSLVGRVRDFANKAVGIVQSYTAPPEPEHKPAASVKSNSKREAQKQKDNRGDERSRHQVAQLAQRGVMGSPFAQAYSLPNYFKPLESWPQGPLDLQGIYSNMILPYYRKTKPDLLGSEWDQFIRLQALLQRCGSDDNSYAKWLIGEYKTLQWSKWRDLLDNGANRVMAADELVKLCKENPAHPSVAGWVQELAKMAETLKGPSPTTKAPEPEPVPTDPEK